MRTASPSSWASALCLAASVVRALGVAAVLHVVTGARPAAGLVAGTACRIVTGGTFVGWSLGWDRGDQNVVLFWLKNTGLFIPLLVGAILWRGERPLLQRRLLLFYAAVHALLHHSESGPPGAMDLGQHQSAGLLARGFGADRGTSAGSPVEKGRDGGRPGRRRVRRADAGRRARCLACSIERSVDPRLRQGGYRLCESRGR